MARSSGTPLGRRAFLAGAGAVVACSRRSGGSSGGAPAGGGAEVDPSSRSPAAPSGGPDPAAAVRAPPSVFALFDAFPALARELPREPLGCYPSPVDRARTLAGAPTIFSKRDDDFTRAPSFDPADPSSGVARAYGGGKLRKLELYLGEARARGARTLVTFGGVGSNQAVAAALVGEALGLAVRLYLAPQPPSVLVKRNLQAAAAARATLRLFPSVSDAVAAATHEAAADASLYLIPPGGTTPLGTLGLVSGGLELARDVERGRLPAPRRVYVALGLGGTAVGLAIGCAAGGLRTEVVAVRASNPGSVGEPALHAIHEETVAFLRARAPAFPRLAPAQAPVRIEGRFVGRGYGWPTPAGDAAVERARTGEGWALEPVYTGKALAAVLAEPATSAQDPVVFWNTASSRPLATAEVPVRFQRFVDG